MRLDSVPLDISRRYPSGRPWERRRYWLPEGFGVPHVSQLVTDEQSHARWSRNEAKQARKNARRLALRDAAYARRLRAAARQGRVIVVSAEASE